MKKILISILLLNINILINAQDHAQNIEIFLYGERMEISGNRLKMLLTVIDDFQSHNSPIERYNVHLFENEEIFMVLFSPISYFSSDIYGNPEYIIGIEYTVAKDDFTILSRRYSR